MTQEQIAALYAAYDLLTIREDDQISASLDRVRAAQWLIKIVADIERQRLVSHVETK